MKADFTGKNSTTKMTVNVKEIPFIFTLFIIKCVRVCSFNYLIDFVEFFKNLLAS